MRKTIVFAAYPVDRQRSRAIVSDPMSPQKHLWRARIVRLSGAGLRVSAIMTATGEAETCVWRWQERFMRGGVDGLLRDRSRRRRPRHGVFRSVVDLQAAINRFVMDDKTQDPRPKAQGPRPVLRKANSDDVIAVRNRGYQMLESIQYFFVAGRHFRRTAPV